jgi:2,3-bisphosphoglycerate-independent phosphoglycerate mutase
MVNFANCDMVGHTGIMEAAIKAVNTVDCVLSKVIPVAYELGYDCMITADHGNAEQMVDGNTGEAFTEHTINPVPFCLLSREADELREKGKLCDIAPTVLDLMGLDKPESMTGNSLILRKK